MKRHLLKARGRRAADNRSACGMRAPPQWTLDPALVTCLACCRTLFMADQEIRLANKKRRNGAT